MDKKKKIAWLIVIVFVLTFFGFLINEIGWFNFFKMIGMLCGAFIFVGAVGYLITGEDIRDIFKG